MNEIRESLRSATRIVALTGAGISAESGIPTFRGPNSLWRKYRPEDIATPQAFARNPELVWEWYCWRRSLIAGAEPNRGHFALAELERKTPHFVLITQNVDGLHDRAGSRNILKVHGDIWSTRCLSCHWEGCDHQTEFAILPPRCACGGMLRPGVVWFGEMLPPGVWRAAEQAVATAEVMLVVGTSAVVYPAAGLVPMAKSAGAKVIEINPEPTALSSQLDCSLRGKAGEILPLLLA